LKVTKIRLAIPVVAAGLGLLVPTAAAAPTVVRGQVGPYRTIQLKDPAGANAQRLKAGMFRFVVADMSEEHNFAVRGPGVNRALTGVEQTGTKSRTVRLRPGVYTFYCQPHARAMRGTFRVIS
jgi:plastocyanin